MMLDIARVVGQRLGKVCSMQVQQNCFFICQDKPAVKLRVEGGRGTLRLCSRAPEGWDMEVPNSVIELEDSKI